MVTTAPTAAAARAAHIPAVHNHGVFEHFLCEARLGEWRTHARFESSAERLSAACFRFQRRAASTRPMTVSSPSINKPITLQVQPPVNPMTATQTVTAAAAEINIASNIMTCDVA